MKAGEGFSGLAHVSEKRRKPCNEFVNRRSRVQIPPPAPVLDLFFAFEASLVFLMSSLFEVADEVGGHKSLWIKFNG